MAWSPCHYPAWIGSTGIRLIRFSTGLTLAGMLQQPYTNKTLGRDLLDTSKKENAAFIIYHAPGWVGVVTDDYFYRNNIRIKKEELVPVRFDTPALTPQQQDSVKKQLSELTSAIYETSRWMLLNNKNK